MSIREIDLAQFHEFARRQIEAGLTDVSLTSLAERWELNQKLAHSSGAVTHPNPRVASARAYARGLAQKQGVLPVLSADQLQCDFLNSVDELDEFLTAVKTGRQEMNLRDPLND